MKNITESASNHDNLDKMSTFALLSGINTEDKKVADAVEAIIPDITNFIENISNKIWYVIDAVSSCDNPIVATYYTHEIIQGFMDENIIENRFGISTLIKEMHK